MKAGFQNGTVQYVFDQIPVEMPSYLPPLVSSKGRAADETPEP